MEHHFKIAISKNYQKLNVDLPKVSFIIDPIKKTKKEEQERGTRKRNEKEIQSNVLNKKYLMKSV
jgi:hypothetical protein